MPTTKCCRPGCLRPCWNGRPGYFCSTECKAGYQGVKLNTVAEGPSAWYYIRGGGGHLSEGVYSEFVTSGAMAYQNGSLTCGAWALARIVGPYYHYWDGQGMAVRLGDLEWQSAAKKGQIPGTCWLESSYPDLADYWESRGALDRIAALADQWTRCVQVNEDRVPLAWSPASLEYWIQKVNVLGKRGYHMHNFRKSTWLPMDGSQLDFVCFLQAKGYDGWIVDLDEEPKREPVFRNRKVKESHQTTQVIVLQDNHFLHVHNKLGVWEGFNGIFDERRVQYTFAVTANVFGSTDKFDYEDMGIYCQGKECAETTRLTD